MRSERYWQSVLVGRIACNAMVGGLLAGMTATISGGVAGAIWDWANAGANVALKIRPMPGISPPSGVMTGLLNGLVVGTLISALVFAVITARAQPGRLFEPTRAFLARVAIGLNAGALGFCSLFLLIEWARTALSGQSFYVQAIIDSGWLFWGTAALMVCGAIAGALSKRGA